MIKMTATIQQFGKQGEKTGWTYITIPADVAAELQPDSKKSFRVKGKLDDHAIKGIALLPMGGGDYILPLNGAMRRAIHKKKGGMLQVQLAVDLNPLELPEGFMDCLADEPAARLFFDSMKPSHRNYFIKWMGGVKTEAAVAKRMAQVINALSRQQDFVTMVRSQKAEKEGRGLS